MELSVNVICFLFILVLCNATEIPRAYSSNTRLKNENFTSDGNNYVESQLKFNKKNTNTTPVHPIPHSDTKWSPWTPLPNGYNVRHESSGKHGNITTLSVKNTSSAWNYGISENRTVNLITPSPVNKERLFNATSSRNSTVRSHGNGTHVMKSSSDPRKSIFHRPDHMSFSKGITYYFWDSIYFIFKCFKDHWKSGVVDCVTSRTTSLLDNIFGVGNSRYHELLGKEGFDILPYGSDLVESPRNGEDGLRQGEEDDDEEYEEEEVYDEGHKDSREGEDDEDNTSRRKIRRKQRRKMKLLLMALLSTMLPLFIAVKLKFFIMMSLGLGVLGLIVGKTIMFTMLAVPAAILASHRTEPHTYWRRKDTIPKPPISRYGSEIDPLAGGRKFR